ncbi:DUF1993 domain-containing protein [Rudaea cellulosilytica]|uniref:DUF1993 domain-containing protein n=1 Tax=Rudaea cellulosilytica TaxID=540746 RepID=UPI0003A89171|nr:DUF1993 domain-containing protein [Rudaea cellulosilytica]
MYYVLVSQCIDNFKKMDGWLDKAHDYAAAKRFDVNVLVGGRLAPDMQPFSYQVQSASDYLKAAAGWLSGQQPPKYEDNEETMEQLRERIRKTVAFAESVPAAAYVDAHDRCLSLPWKPGKVIAAADYIKQITIPNVYFHLAMAYAILRHQGVDIGKMDFLSQLNFIDPQPSNVQ